MTFWNNLPNLLPKQQHRWVISLGNSTEFTDQTANVIPRYYAKSVDRPSYSIKSVQAKYLFAHSFNFPTRLNWNSINITFYDVKFINDGKKFYWVSKTSLENYDAIRSPAPKAGDKKILKTQEEIISASRIARESGGQFTQAGTKTIQDFEQDTNEYDQSTQLFFYSFLRQAGYFSPDEFQRPDQLLRFRDYHFKKDMINALVGDNPDYNDYVKVLVNGDDPNNLVVDTATWKTINIIEIDESGKAIETWKIYNPLISDVKFDKLDYSAENVLSISVKIDYDWAELVPSTKIKSGTDITFKEREKPKETPPRAQVEETRREGRVGGGDAAQRSVVEVSSPIVEGKENPTVTRVNIFGALTSENAAKTVFNLQEEIKRREADPEAQHPYNAKEIIKLKEQLEAAKQVYTDLYNQEEGTPTKRGRAVGSTTVESPGPVGPRRPAENALEGAIEALQKQQAEALTAADSAAKEETARQKQEADREAALETQRAARIAFKDASSELAAESYRGGLNVPSYTDPTKEAEIVEKQMKARSEITAFSMIETRSDLEAARAKFEEYKSALGDSRAARSFADAFEKYIAAQEKLIQE